MHKLTKTELRIKFKNIRNNITSSEIERKSDLICNNFLNTFVDNNLKKTYFIYKSFSSEVKTGDIIDYLLNNGHTVLIPKCLPDCNLMNAVKLNTADTFSKNIYGIDENNSIGDFRHEIDVIVLPGLVFDRRGNRIGYGKGYYDNFINSLKNKPELVALSFKEQISDIEIPSDNNDVKCNFIVTEDEIIKTN